MDYNARNDEIHDNIAAARVDEGQYYNAGALWFQDQFSLAQPTLS